MTRVAAAALVLGALAAPAAAEEQQTILRVLSERAEIRTGPSFTYRVVYAAERGETLPALARAPSGFWFRVLLPDGTHGWILGDEVVPLIVDTRPPPPPTLGQRFAAAVFSPPPLSRGDVALSFSAGLLGGEGMVMFRPALLLAPHLALEGFVGETVGEQTDVLYYGAGAALFLFPASPVTPFLAAGAGGAHGRRKADQFTIRTGHYGTASAGGGLLVALKKRITVRIEARDHLVFDANYTRELQEYSGGLSIVF